MDLEATVVERLQKLREWQLQQQERLFKQQQMQRDMLTQRQDCIYKVLELSIQELDCNDDVGGTNHSNENIQSAEINNKNIVPLCDELQMGKDCVQMMDSTKSSVKQNINNMKNITSHLQPSTEEMIDNIINIDNPIKSQEPRGNVMCNNVVENETKFTLNDPKVQTRRERFMIDGVAPLTPDKTTVNRICLDDIPIPSPRKDFHVLLEERLKEYEIQSSKKFDGNLENKVKKPFLRKGEGLSRFKFNHQTHLPPSNVRLRSSSFTHGTPSNSRYCKNENTINKISRSSKPPQLTKSANGASTARKQLCLKNIPLPEKKVRSKSESSTSVMGREDYIKEIKNLIELNCSDFQSRTQKELEEVRIFELLEEKAENSSFCSTSSAVVAFLQQSTPFKMKKVGYKAENNVLNTMNVTPMITTPKDQSILKSNKMYKYAACNNSADTYKDLSRLLNKKVIPNNAHKGIPISQDIHEDDTVKVNGSKHIQLKNPIRIEQNSCDNPDIENDSEADVSLHVRFSEYNEYKTIGLTDTSSVSTDSIVTKNCSDDKVWSDSSISETSTIEAPAMPFDDTPKSSIIINEQMQEMKHTSHFEQCHPQRELNHRTHSYQNMRQNNITNNDTGISQHTQYKDMSEFSDTAYYSPDEEGSILHDYSQNDLTPQKVENLVSNLISMKGIEKSNNAKIDKYVSSNSNEIEKGQENKENLDDSNETVFKSELLKSRLLQLEQEISIFRKENTALSLQRKKLQDDYRNLHKEYTEKERKFEENRKQAEDRLQEERKKLAREKAALENRMRDSQEKAQQSKLERQEMQILRDELEKLRDEMHTKESRWNAAQSRHKCQMRILKTENSKLKQEIEKLQSLKKGNIRNKGKPGSSSNTKTIHQINKQLNMQFKEYQKMNDISSDEGQTLRAPLVKGANTTNYRGTEREKELSDYANKDGINEKLPKCQPTAIDIAKKRDLYQNLIKEATLDLTDVYEQSVKDPENLNESKSNMNSSNKKVDSREIITENCEKLYKGAMVPSNHSNTNSNIQMDEQNDYIRFISSTNAYEGDTEKDLASATKDELTGTNIESASSFGQSNATMDKQAVKEIQQNDGSIEYWFPNGNVKKIFPDQGSTRLIYYNGDIRETNKDGKIKYFYASTRTWHTTMPDGLEILEFADGQVERRSHNGTVEISFPDGSVRILESDGIEKWSLPDGTLIQILTNGEKILTLPNGQREVHTTTHKRREYPDGTIKLIYLDGTQETRYSNGRIRLKDKDGNLLMDSYQ